MTTLQGCCPPFITYVLSLLLDDPRLNAHGLDLFNLDKFVYITKSLSKFVYYMSHTSLAAEMIGFLCRNSRKILVNLPHGSQAP